MPGAGVNTFWSYKRQSVGCVDLQCLAMPRPRTEFKFYITKFRIAVNIVHVRPGIDITNLYTPGLISTVIAERKENQLSCWIEIRSAAVSVTVPVLWPEHHWQHPSCWQHWHPHYRSGAVTTNKDHRDLSALHMAWHGYLPKIILN